MKISTIGLVLVVLESACTKAEQKTEKQVKVEMNMINDSTAEATVTISEDSAGEKKETVSVIKGHPKQIQQEIESKQ